MFQKIRFTGLVLLICSVGFVCLWQPVSAQQKNPSRVPYELPETSQHDEIIQHFAYTLAYDATYKQADWVSYMFTKKMTVKKYPRTNKFRKDPNITTGSAELADYKQTAKAKYDKGHLTPCDDMRWSKTAESESFYLSNMSPQTHSFNAGIWKKLEGLVHTYASVFDTIYVVTGPILETGLATIGKNKVAVPKYFYKVVLVYTQHTKQAIGFILPHKQSQKDLMSFAVPVDSVEARTHINFFYAVPESIQNKLESSIDLTKWRVQ